MELTSLNHGDSRNNILNCSRWQVLSLKDAKIQAAMLLQVIGPAALKFITLLHGQMKETNKKLT